MDGRSIKMAWESGGLWVWVERRKDADKKNNEHGFSCDK